MAGPIQGLLVTASERVLAKAIKTYATELAAEQAALDAAVRDKRPLANHYWQGRHRAEQRVRAALAICDAIHEANEY